MEITKEMLESELKGISVRLPEKLHNEIKSIAAKNGKTKDQLFLEIVKEGCKSV